MSGLGRLASTLGKTLVPDQGMRVELRALQQQLAGLSQLALSHVRTKRRLSDVQGRELLFNFGCGAIQDERWINVDVIASNGTHFADLRSPLPLADGCAAHIHCEHFLEHLEYFYAKRLLAEFHRILRAGGTLRIVVPDAGKYFHAYVQNDGVFFDRLKDLGNPGVAFTTRIEVINQMFRMAGAHRFAWDHETLELALREAGFSRIERSARGTMTPSLDIDGTDWWREIESLYVNAAQ